MNKRLITSSTLYNLIICDPITTKGIKALNKLGLLDQIDLNYFFDELHINSRFTDDYVPIKPDVNEMLNHNYFETLEDFKNTNSMLNRFTEKLSSNTIKESPLFMVGATGNGKSIEINYQIYNFQKNESAYSSLCYNFEESISMLTHGSKFSLSEDQRDEPMWLILMVVLRELYNLIERNQDKTSDIKSNHQKLFEEKGSADQAQINVFENIENFSITDVKSQKKLFDSLIELVDKDVARSIENLLEITMNVLYCINPQRKNFIIFDNLENYIKVNNRDVPIPNDTILRIKKICEDLNGNMVDIYNRIGAQEIWKAFKIVLVLRRTSARMLGIANEQFVAQILQKGNDYTGYFNIWDIWNNKRKLVWEKFLDKQYEEHQKKIVFEILEGIMNDTPKRAGTSYQTRISILMDFSIRRLASAHAYVTMKIYDLILENTDYCIDFEQYSKLYDKTNATRYLYRHMLLELQYRRMSLSEASKESFNKLYLDATDKRATFVRRILAFLSHFPDNQNYVNDNGVHIKSKMFQTVPLFDLMKRIFIRPTEVDASDIQKKYSIKCIVNNINICNEHDPFQVLAEVLISLSCINNSVRKSAPFIILGVNDKRFSSYDPEEALCTILKEIWAAGENESRNNSKYNLINYGLRLTDAGSMFLFDIQASFPFFSSLYAKEEIPLYLLKDSDRIVKLINLIQNKANTLCSEYEATALSFCGPNVSITREKYLPMKDRYITFRQRVRELHIQYLGTYKDFVIENSEMVGFTAEQKTKIISSIDENISRYNKWENNLSCF